MPKRETALKPRAKAAASSRPSAGGLSEAHQSFLQDGHFFDQVLESLEDYAVFTTDVAGNVSSWNAGAEKLLGYCQEEIIGQNAAIFFTPEDLAKEAPAHEMNTARRVGKARDERFHVRRDGSSFWASGLVFPLRDRRGVLRGFTKIMRDLTERQAGQEKLKKSEQHFRTLIERSFEAVALSDEQGRYTYATPAVERILGYTPEEFVGVNGFDIVHPDDKAELAGRFKELLIPGTVATATFRFRHKEGRWIWIEATATNLLDDPEIGAIVSNFRDISERKRVLAELEESETRFRNLADNMPNLAWMADPEGWIYWYNSRWYEYTGATPKDMEGWGWQSVHNPEELPKVVKKWKSSIKSGKTFEMVFPLRGVDGSYRQFLTRVVPLRNQSGHIIQWFGTNTDITDQKQIEADLEIAKAKAEEQQRRLHDLFMQAPAMIAVCRGPDLVFELANPVYLKVVGKTEAILGKGLLEAFPELAGQPILDILFNVYKTGKPFLGSEIPVKINTTDDGGPKEIFFTFVYQPVRDSKGKIDGVMTHAIDVTGQVRSRQRIQESEERFRFMAESLPQKIFTADPDGHVDYFNPQWTDYTGVPMDVLMKEGVRRFVHPDDLPGNMRSWRRALRTGRQIQNEQRLLRADGQYRRHVSFVRPMLDGKGKVMRWFGSMTDIEDIERTTAQRDELEHLNTVLKEQRADLIALNRSKDEFISLASHQLRTPATGVKQFLGMVIEGYAGDITKAQQKMLRRAYDSNDRQIAIVNDLLKVAQVDAGKVALRKRSVNLVQLVGEELEEQESLFQNRRQTVTFTYSDKDINVRADPDRLRMVLDNLVDNASKYTFEGKNISVHISNAGDMACIAITDEGVGMKAADRDKLFGKFTRFDNPLSVTVGGTGLGLYWAKKIIDLHGGTIEVSSVLNKGSTFRVCLPR